MGSAGLLLRMTSARRYIVIAAIGVGVLMGSVALAFATVGCEGATSAASTTYSTPGVYINSTHSFSAGFESFVRDANPACG